MVISAGGLIASPICERERTALRRAARHAVPIAIVDRSAAVHFEDAASARLFASRYRDLAGRGAADQRTYVARDPRGHTHFWTDDEIGYTWPHGPLRAEATAFLADAVALHALLTTIPSAIALHAAALQRDGRAFAITGHSTAGKSTTAIAGVALGCTLYSDERCVVTPAGALPFPRAMNLRRGGIDLLVEDLPPGGLRTRLEAHRGNDWSEIHFADLFETVSLPQIAPLSALFAIVGRAAAPRSRRISGVAMFPYAQFGAYVAATGIDRASTILSMLQRVACYELVLGGPRASAQHVLDVVARGDAL